jgi:ribosome recycling factor
MNEELDIIFEGLKEQNESSMEHLKAELRKVRAGKATPSMLDSVSVDYYGSATALSQVANVSTLDAKTLTVQPWEKQMLDEISKGIINANLGLAPQNNGEMIIISVPVLTEERRRDLAKQVKSIGEHGKISLRNGRKEANDSIKKMKEEGLSEDLAKDAESNVQNITNKYSANIDTLLEVKEKDIMTV